MTSCGGGHSLITYIVLESMSTKSECRGEKKIPSVVHALYHPEGSCRQVYDTTCSKNHLFYLIRYKNSLCRCFGFFKNFFFASSHHEKFGTNFFLCFYWMVEGIHQYVKESQFFYFHIMMLRNSRVWLASFRYIIIMF